jgi:hypothetical protein
MTNVDAISWRLIGLLVAAWSGALVGFLLGYALGATR